MSAAKLFQLVALAALAVLVAGKALHVLYGRRAIPVTIFARKPAVLRLLDGLFVVGGGTFAFRVLLHVFGSDFLLFPPLPVVLVDSRFARVLGAILIVGALVVLALAYRSLGMSWRIGIDDRTPGPLVVSGPYRWSRHPIYFAADLYVIGTFLMNGTVLFLLFATLGPVLLHVQAMVEERSLHALYGRDYAEYATRTPRYPIPRRQHVRAGIPE